MTKILPEDSSVEAEYEDGFILNETDNFDQSIYVPMIDVRGIPSGPNTLTDIIEKFPEHLHGRMIRFSVYWKNARYDIDWTMLPENARPIRFRDRSSWIDGSGNTGQTDWQGCRFGYQYNDAIGKNHQEVREL